MSQAHRCGVVAVLGRPNVGKSTLVNTLVGQKVSIVSARPQTTRRRVTGICTRPGFQIVFVDTPGVHKAGTRMGKALNEQATRGVEGTDLVLAVVDASQAPGPEDQAVARLVPPGEPLVLCLNKMDRTAPHHVQPHYDGYRALFPTEEIMWTSFTRGQNLVPLVDLVVARLPEREPLFPEDEYTDQPMRNIAAELIREQVLKSTRQEVPHAVATYVETWEEEGRLTRIGAVILVEREGQKAIMIGKQGSMLRQVGEAARLEIEDLVGGKVFLQLFVKVREDWRDDTRMLRELGILEG